MDSAAMTGDYVGAESCIDLRNEEDFEAYARDCERSYERRRRRKKAAAAAEVVDVNDDDGGRRRRRMEFPPPITYLARTENQPSHMPWVMKRYYTDDGRLVIREEKVRHHEYFRVHRADGRLTLHLVPLDRDRDDNARDYYVDDTLNANEDVVEVEEGVVEEAAARVMVSSVSMAALCVAEGVRSGGMLTSASSSCLSPAGGGNKCYGFNSLRSSSASSLFHLQVPAIRPVIS